MLIAKIIQFATRTGQDLQSNGRLKPKRLARLKLARQKSNLYDIYGLRTLLSLGDFKFYRLTFV